MEYYAVNAKLSAMRSALFSEEDYDALCRQGSVQDVSGRLREKLDYRRTLLGLEDVQLHRHIVEQRIALSLYHDYERVRLYFYDKSTRTYLASLFLRYALDYLKLLLCVVFDERDAVYTLPEMNLLLSRLIKLDWPKLAAAKTIPVFIELLRGTELYSLLSDTYARQPSLFALERQLDLYYYMQLWKKQETLLNKSDRAIMKRITGTEIDLRNIIWIYRLKYYYRITDARIYAYLIPISHRLDTESLNRMVECDSIAAFMDEVAIGPYGRMLTDFSHTQQQFAHVMRAAYIKENRMHPQSLVAAAWYIFDKEQEIRNITSALEGVRYQLPPEEIMRYLCL